MGIIDWFKKPAQKRFDQAIPEIKISITHSTTPSSERISRSELIAKSKDALSASKLEDIGNTDPICPNCSQALERMPHRKTKCPSCGSFIYVRTRPSDRKKVLVSGSQVLLIEEQCAEQSAIIYGYHETYLAKRREFDKEKAAMDEKFGRDIPYGDVKLSIYNQELLEHASNNNWGLYRNTKLQMAEVLELEDSPSVASTL